MAKGYIVHGIGAKLGQIGGNKTCYIPNISNFFVEKGYLR